MDPDTWLGESHPFDIGGSSFHFLKVYTNLLFCHIEHNVVQKLHLSDLIEIQKSKRNSDLISWHPKTRIHLKISKIKIIIFQCKKNPAVVGLLFNEAMGNFLNGSFSCEEKDMVFFAAIISILRFGQGPIQ